MQAIPERNNNTPTTLKAIESVESKGNLEFIGDCKIELTCDPL